MIQLDFTLEAREDIASLLRRSRRDFGTAAQNRYRWLIQRAAYDLRVDPARAGVRSLGGGLFTYHLRSSRLQLPRENRVRSPRHLFIFRRDDDVLTVLRVLDERMDLETRMRSAV